MIIILDFGSQTTQLIARRIREQHVYCEVWPYTKSLEAIRAAAPEGIVLSGGPSSVYEKDAPDIDAQLFALGVPVLGICYGLQLLVHKLGGKVEPSAHAEYGRAQVKLGENHPLFAGMTDNKSQFEAWMSHGDKATKLPEGFRALATTPTSPYTAIADDTRRLFGVQFHPEVVHTPKGAILLENFLALCKAKNDWTMGHFQTVEIEKVRQTVGKGERVICALSGGVDSSVVAALLAKAIPEQLTCVFVDTGLQRMNERVEVERVFKDHFKIDLRVIDAAERFFKVLAGVTDPEDKRKRIGRTFIEVFEEVAKPLAGAKWLAQGTLYPDVIESVSVRGPSVTIKSHHNVGGLPEKMNLKLIEPLRELFKDEVRELGRELGLPSRIVERQPFPGPGMAVRVLGEVTEEAVAIVQAADAIVEDELRATGLYQGLWQAFAVLLPVKSVGVAGDARTYARTIAIRAVTSTDGMTADVADLPVRALSKLATRIINEVKGVGRVVYDISQKPPATIEWE